MAHDAVFSTFLSHFPATLFQQKIFPSNFNRYSSKIFFVCKLFLWTIFEIKTMFFHVEQSQEAAVFYCDKRCFILQKYDPLYSSCFYNISLLYEKLVSHFMRIYSCSQNACTNSKLICHSKTKKISCMHKYGTECPFSLIVRLHLTINALNI